MRRVKLAFYSLALSLATARAAFADLSGESEPEHWAGTPDPAKMWDHLWAELMADIWIIGIVFGLAALYMMMKYKANNLNEEGSGPKLSTANALGWVLIPVFLFMADDFFLAAKGWTLWTIYRNPPADAMEVKVTGVQWAWSYTYANGAESDVLNVPTGKPVVLRMSSDDVIHSYFLPSYRVKEDLMPGRVTYIWFNPVEDKKTFVTCTEYCGTGHSQMYGDVVAMPQADYDSWMASIAPAAAPAEAAPAEAAPAQGM